MSTLIATAPQGCLDRPYVLWGPPTTTLTNAEYFAQHPGADYRMTASVDGVAFYNRAGHRSFFSLSHIREDAWWRSKNPHRTPWKHLFKMWD